MSGSQIKCAQCGTCGNDETMFVCSGCFSVHFCSEEHFQQHPHSKIEDAQHFDPTEIGPNIRRLFRKGKFEPALSILTHDYTDYVDRVAADRENSGAFKMGRNSMESFLAPLSRSRKDDFRRELTKYFDRLEETVSQSFAQRKLSILPPSNELIHLWAQENRFSVHQREIAIQHAWGYYNAELLLYVDKPTAEQKRKIEDLHARVGRMLGGGKDELKE